MTESQRKVLAGKLVLMVHSPEKVCEDIIAKLKDPLLLIAGLKELSTKASDPTVAEIFVAQGGLNTLLEIIEQDKIGGNEEGLQAAFVSLLDIVFNSANTTWDKIQGSVLSK